MSTPEPTGHVFGKPEMDESERRRQTILFGGLFGVGLFIFFATFIIYKCRQRRHRSGKSQDWEKSAESNPAPPASKEPYDLGVPPNNDQERPRSLRKAPPCRPPQTYASYSVDRKSLTNNNPFKADSYYREANKKANRY